MVYPRQDSKEKNMIYSYLPKRLTYPWVFGDEIRRCSCLEILETIMTEFANRLLGGGVSSDRRHAGGRRRSSAVVP